MFLGITVLGTDSVFAKGVNRTAIALAMCFQQMGHSVTLIHSNKLQTAFAELRDILNDKNINNISIEEFISNKKRYDLTIEVAWYVPEDMRKTISRKSVMWFHTPPLFNDMEGSIYTSQTLLRKMTHIDEVWMPDVFSKDDGIYIERIYNIPVKSVPWIWENESLDSFCKKADLSKWNEKGAAVYNCAILESNTTNTSNCTLPLCIVAEICKKDGIEWVVSNGQKLASSPYFRGNILHNLFPGYDVSGNFIGRIPTPELRRYKTILVTHQRWRPLKHLLLDAMWMDIPMIHNNDVINNALQNNGGYFYSLNDISTAVDCFSQLTADEKNSSGFFSHNAVKLRKNYLSDNHHWQSVKIQQFFSNALSSLLSIPADLQVERIKGSEKILRLAFCDMWQDFNPDYNFFTCLMLEHYPSSEIVVDTVKPDLVIFGPFGTDHLKYAGIPKIFFSGESTHHLAGDEVVMSVGHGIETNEKTLRLPLWILEIDWFKADPARIRNPKPIPYEMCVKPQLNILGKKNKFCSYIVSNPKNTHRNEALPEISRYKHVDSAGLSQNNMGFKLEGGLGGGGGELIKNEFLSAYKFNICFENLSMPGYITEKYFHAKAAGCIPIYWGDPEISRDFDETGGINAFGKTWEQLRSEIETVDKDDMKYLKMFAVPALPKKSEDFARKQMRRLADVIAKYGKGQTVVVLATAKSDEPTNKKIRYVTAANNQYFSNVFVWLEGLIEHEKATDENMVVYVWPDVPSTSISSLKQRYRNISIETLPTTTVKPFFQWKSSQFWDPQHYAWKLWILQNEAKKGGYVFYSDAGVLITKTLSSVVSTIEKDGIFLLEDEGNKNRNWCHTTFVDILGVSETELNENQLQAGVIGFDSGKTNIVEAINLAYRFANMEDVVVGEKWNNREKDSVVHGHRHDQSILSIVSSRFKFKRQPLGKYTTCESYKAAIGAGFTFYHHRGNIKVGGGEGGEGGETKSTDKIPHITEAYVINLDRRQDRYKSFIEAHPNMEKSVKRISACDGKMLELDSEVRNLFRNNDFKWKKAIMGCAISHNRIWQDLAKKENTDSYLILEDDVRFRKDWISVWEKAFPHIPADTDVIYLGGILPPNRDSFQKAIEAVNEYFVRIKPNDIFNPGHLRQYFHSCNYSYILYGRGAKKLASLIHEKGIFTSGDHMIVNHMDKLNIYFMNPLVAGCFQDNDPSYQQSQFNNFDRVDKFDSDLWNNTEHFTDSDIVKFDATVDVKPSSRSDVMVEGMSVEGNSILLKLAQNKHDEVIAMSIDFLIKKSQQGSRNEDDFNWARVIQQIMISLRMKIEPNIRKSIFDQLTEAITKVDNYVYTAVLQEVIDKYSDAIFEKGPAILIYANPSTVDDAYIVWYFVADQQNQILEREWLEEIIGKPMVFNPYGKHVIEKSKKPQFVLIQKWQEVESKIRDQLDSMEKANIPAVLIHISDEHLNDSLDIYSHPAVKLVLRNYVRADLPKSPKIITFPLGFVNHRSSRGNYKKLSERKFAWSFLGSVDKGDRLEMLKKLHTLEPNHMKLLTTWVKPSKSEADEYKELLTQTKVVPCSGGQNFETFRLYEALESGTIPICVADPKGGHECYNELIGQGTILIMPDWNAVKAMIEKIHNNPALGDQLQENLTKYWLSHKLSITAKIISSLADLELNQDNIKKDEPMIIHL